MSHSLRRLPPALLSLAPLVATGALLLGCAHQASPPNTEGPPTAAVPAQDSPSESPSAEAGTALVSPPPPSQRPWMNPAASPEERTKLLVAQMTEKEKLTIIFGYFATDAPWKNFKAPAEGREGSAGYVPGVPRLGIPAQWQTDAAIGVGTQGSAPHKRERTALPSGLAVASTWNPELAKQGGAMIGSEARDSGFNIMLAGPVNLLRDAYNGRNFEYGGEDPLLAGTMVGSAIAGIQSNHIISTVKHFAVNDQETDRNKGNSIIEDAAARTSDLLAFAIAIERGTPGALMCAYNRVNGIYSCESPYLLTEVLRTDWGYRGYVLADWGATHSAAQAANAGLEQETGWPFDDKPYFQEPLQAALAKGEVTAARLDEMVSRILYSMFANGLFDDPVNEETPIDLDANARVSQSAAEEGIVLLKNEGRLLPLSDKTKSIAVIGGHADKGVLSGGGSSQVYPVGGNAVPGLEPQVWPGPVIYYPSSPLREIERLAPQAKVQWNDGTDAKAAATLAKESDVVIVFVTQWATESIDTTIELGAEQDGLVKAVAKANSKTIVVLETGGPVLMPWAANVAAIVEAWYPGTAGGAAIANVLLGKVNPSGHLPATFAKMVDQLAHPDKPHEGDVQYNEGATVGYKWFDVKGTTPLFAFGHGLSYTTFSYEQLSAKPSGETIDVSFVVKNKGKLAGKDVAQVYVAGRGWEGPKRLGAFEKVTLAPGEQTEVHVQIDPRLLATWSTEKHQWEIAAGDYEVLLGESSRSIVKRVSVKLPARTLPATWHPSAPAGTP